MRAVAAFEAAARHESFTKAADELNLTQSAISHAIRGLEERLGAVLFARVGRNVCLTHEGAKLAKRVRVSLSLLTDALDRRPQLDGARLSIGADVGVVLRLLAPRLGAFKALHPEINIDLRCIASTAALAGGEIDVALRSGSGVELGVSSRMIVRERLYPTAAPSFAVLSGAAELPNGQLIESREHPWSLWFEHTKAGPRTGPPALTVDTDLLAIEMAKAGAGVCLSPDLLVQQDVQDGALIRLSHHEVSAGSGYHLDWSSRSARRDEIMLFLAWLGEAFSPPLEAWSQQRGQVSQNPKKFARAPIAPAQARVA